MGRAVASSAELAGRRPGVRAGTLIMAIAVFHEVAGLGLYARPLMQILRGGVFDTVMPDFGTQHYGAQAGFWFMIAGPVALMLGALANWAEARTGTLPAWLGWGLLALTLAGVVPFPVSGFWLFLAPAMLILARARRGA